MLNSKTNLSKTATFLYKKEKIAHSTVKSDLAKLSINVDGETGSKRRVFNQLFYKT